MVRVLAGNQLSQQENKSLIFMEHCVSWYAVVIEMGCQLVTHAIWVRTPNIVSPIKNICQVIIIL